MGDIVLSDDDVGFGAAPSAPEQKVLSDEDVGFAKTKPVESKGVLSNSKDDGWISGAAKGATTGVIKGAYDIVGMPGNLREFGHMVNDQLFGGLPNAFSEKGWSKGVEDWRKAREKGEKEFGSLQTAAPTGEQLYRPVLEKTGEYKPTSTAGKMAQAGVEAAVGGVGPGSGGAIAGMGKKALESTLSKAAIGSSALAGAASEGAMDVQDEKNRSPIVGLAAGLAAGPSAHLAGHVFKKQVAPIAAPFSKTVRERLGAEQLQSYSDNPEGLAASIEANPDEEIKGSKLTLGQATGDRGILEAERQFQTGNDDFREKYNQREQEQNEAAIDALRRLPSKNADVSDLVSDIESKHRAITEQFDRQEESLRQKARSQAEALGEKADPIQVGEKLRGEIQAAREAEKKKLDALYAGIDPEMRLVTSPLREGVAEVEGRRTQSTKWGSELEQTLDLAKNAPEVWSLKEIRGLGKRITDAMREERMAKGESETWSGLNILNGKVKDAINNAIEHHQAWEEAAGVPKDQRLERRYGHLDDGTAVPGETVAGADERLAATGTDGLGDSGLFAESGEARSGDGGSGNADRGAGLPTAASPTGTNKVFYPGGNVDVRYKVVDLDDLNISHDLDFNENPNYPKDLQPRNRSSQESKDQVIGYGNNLNPELLGHSKVSSHGAPIIGKDGVVESGNGRAMSVGLNYAKGDPAGYRKWVESQGYDTTGMKRPVIVAERMTDMTPAERVYFAEQSNGPSGLRMTATEQAGVDAKFLTPDVLEKLQEGSLHGETNADFVMGWLRKLSSADRGGLWDNTNKKLTPDGERRLKAAILQSAFGDTDLVQRGFASADNNIKNITGALADAAGPWAKMRAAAKDGLISADHDVTKDVVDLVKDVMRARDKGEKLVDVINQLDMTRGEAGNAVRQLLLNGDRVASKAQITARLTKYAEESLKNTGGGFLDDKISPSDILKKSEEARFVEPEGDAATHATGAGEAMPVEKLQPNMTKEMADKLNAANKQYGEYAQTYKNGEVGKVLKTEGGKDQYRVMDSAVASRAVVSGDRGYQTANQFFKAAKNSEGAIDAMKEAVLNHFRNAVDGDGILSIKSIDALFKKFDGAIKAIDEKSPGFADKLRSPKKSAEMLGALLERKKQVADTLKKDATARFLGLHDATDIEHAVGKLLDGNSVQRVRDVVKGLSPEALDGFRLAAIDWMMRAKTNVAKVGVGETPALSYAKVDRMLRNKRAMLAEVFTPEQLNLFDALHRNLMKIDRSVQATRIKGSPGTAKDVMKHLSSAGSAVADQSIFAMGAYAMIHGYEVGGFSGVIKYGAPAFLLQVGRNFAARGAQSVNDVVKQALLDPQFAREILKKAPTPASSEKLLARALVNSITRMRVGSATSITPRMNEDRRRRASGGRLLGALTPDQIISGLERSRDVGKKRTEAILNKPDEVVVRALEMANQHI